MCYPLISTSPHPHSTSTLRIHTPHPHSASTLHTHTLHPHSTSTLCIQVKELVAEVLAEDRSVPGSAGADTGVAADGEGGGATGGEGGGDGSPRRRSEHRGHLNRGRAEVRASERTVVWRSECSALDNFSITALALDCPLRTPLHALQSGHGR